MTAATERILEQIRNLPPPELRIVWRELNALLSKLEATPSPSTSHEEVMAALDRLTGCTSGSGSVQRLLEERQRDWQREEGEVRDYLARHQDRPDA